MERQTGVGSPTKPLSEHAEDAAQTARERVSEKAQEGGERLREHATESVEEFAEAMRESADRLEGQHASVAPLLRGAAEQLANFAEQMRNKSLRESMADLETVARRNPLVFFAGSVLLGFSATKLLRSTRSASQGYI